LNHVLTTWTIDSTSKRQYVACFGSNDEMLFVDCAFDTA